MKKLPSTLLTEFSAFIEKRGVQADKHRFYLKWLRFYLDFYDKYRLGLFDEASPSSFDKKLKDKKLSEGLRKQRVHLIFDMFTSNIAVNVATPCKSVYCNQKNSTYSKPNNKTTPSD